MSLSAGTVYVDVRPDTSAMTKKGSGGLGTAMKTAGLVAAGAFAASFLKGSIAEAKESEKVGLMFSDAFSRGTEHFDSAALAKHFDDINNAMGVSDEALDTWAAHFNNAIDFTKFGANAEKMLTDLTALVPNIAAQTGKSTSMVEKTLTKLGTAPTTAIPLLKNMGVLTQAQADHALKLAEAGKVVEAQEYAVQAATKKTQGAAENQTTASEKLAIAYGEIQEKVGTALLPALNGLASVGIKVLDFFTSGSAASKVAMVAIGALGAAMLYLKVQTALASQEGMLYLAKTAIIKGATAAWTAVQWLLNAAMSANPIGLVVLAIAALVAAFVLAWKKSETFRKIVTAVFEAVKKTALTVWNGIKAAAVKVWNFLAAAVRIYFGIYKAVFTAIWDVAKTVWDKVTGVFRGAWDTIRGVWGGVKDFFSGIWDSIKGGAVSVWNAIANAWNSTIGSLSFRAPSWVPVIGGKGWDVPDIPTVALAAGGVVTQPTSALIGEAGPEAVIPLRGRTLDVRVVNPHDFPDGSGAAATAARLERTRR